MRTSEPTSEIRGCAPQCGTGFADPGRLPIGPYSTTYFFDGQLTVTFDEEWESHEDQSVEFSVAPLGQWEDHRVLFWADIQPVGPDGEPVSGVPITAEGFLGWLQDRPNLDVSDPRSATIGVDQLPAVVVDIGIAPDATNEVSGCPFPVCVDLLTWPNSGAVYGTADTYVLRLYLADVTYGGQTHLFAIGIEGSDTADLEEFLSAAEALIATATAPVSPG